MTIEGLVIQATGSWYEVLNGAERIKCRIRGKLRLKGVRSTNPVVVGDIVRCECDQNGEWVIYDIVPRRNYIIRRASNLSKESHIIAANIDRAMIVVTLVEPVTALEFVDRFLVTCEAYKVPVTILLAKIDLLRDNPDSVAEFHRIYEGAGYEVIDISATEGIGVERVKEMLSGKTTLLSGNSGVGKSTLIGAIDPTIDIRTGEISDSFHKGKHTTTFSTMYPIGNNGYIIDTPGIKGFGTFDMEREEVSHYFREIFMVSAECRFGNCTHTHEPGCAVLQAVAEGGIAESRFTSYLSMLEDKDEDKYRGAT